MQNQNDENDDYAFALRLQQQFFEEANGINSEDPFETNLNQNNFDSRATNSQNQSSERDPFGTYNQDKDDYYSKDSFGTNYGQSSFDDHQSRATQSQSRFFDDDSVNFKDPFGTNHKSDGGHYNKDNKNKDNLSSQKSQEDDDYAMALRLQQMYNDEGASGNNFDDLASRMGNMTFENENKTSSNKKQREVINEFDPFSDYYREEDKYHNKTRNEDLKREKSSQGGFGRFDDDFYRGENSNSSKGGMNNFDYDYHEELYSNKNKNQKVFDDDDKPPPYAYPINPPFNNPNNSLYSNPYSSNFSQKSQLDPNIQAMQSMVTQLLQAMQNQQNDKKPDYSTRNNDDYPERNNNNYNNNNYGNTRTRINLSGRGPQTFRILLLGGTGTGKSTIINTMTNYFLGGTLDNPKVVIPTKFHRVTEREYASKHSEAQFDDVTKSQTTKCFNYTFNHPDNPASKFIFIDTPGLSDTNGVKQDDKNIKEIINTAISAGSLSAVVIIANGTEARLTPSIKNTLVRLSNNLPDDLMGNLLLILTKCSRSSASFSEADFEKEFAKPKRIFYMDNQAFCTDPKIWKYDDEERLTVQIHWDKSLRTIDSLLTLVTEMSSTSTQAFEKMKTFRDKIKSEITKVTQDIANIQKIQDSLDAAQKALQKTGDQKKSFANYTKTEKIKLKKVVKADYHSTVCTLHLKENIICHNRCGLEFNNSSGNDHFVHCTCMGGGNKCTQCGCGAKSHFHDKIKIIEETQTINQVLEDMKAQYDNASQQHRKYSSDANNYQSTLANLQAAANAKYDHIHKLCIELSKICSRFNFVDELHANIESMKQDSRTIQNTSIRKNAEVEIQKLEKLANDLSSKKGRTY